MTEPFENRLEDLFAEPGELPDALIFAAQVEARLAAEFRRTALVVGALCALGAVLTYPLIGRAVAAAADDATGLIAQVGVIMPSAKLWGLTVAALIAAGLGGYQAARR